MKSYHDFFDPKTFTVDLAWKGYAGIVLPRHVSQVQHDETKKAFHAGFLECFKVMSDYASALDEDAACELFNRLADESRAFFERMVKEHGVPR